MRSTRLAARGLVHYWRTNLAVVLGVATAVAVLGGALLVGDSVRASLRDLVLRRLGATTHAVSGPRFFREGLAEAVAGQASPALRVCPMVVLRGVVTAEPTGRRASDVFVYGIDARFFALHGLRDPELGLREALVSEPLAAELALEAGATALVRVERTEDVSAATLFGRRDDLGRTLRVKVKKVQPGAERGEFALRAGQHSVKAVFVPLRLVQRSLARDAQANTLLLAGTEEKAAVEAALDGAVTLEDLGLRVRTLPARASLAVESEAALLDDTTVESVRGTAAAASWPATPVLTYLANEIRHGEREVPYSLVTGLDPVALREIAPGAEIAEDGVVLNDWAARALAAKPGDALELDYFLWQEEGTIETRTASFTVAAVVPLAGPADDRDLAPAYPGITDSLHLADWDPPFPVELDRVKPRDEDYWRDHRTTPKAFVPLERAQHLWGHRLGRVSSMRVRPPSDLSLEDARTRFERAFLGRLGPAHFGLAVEAVRADGLAAATGSTDFGEYFVYFSFFLVVSALLLAALFFRLGVEQRLAEVGLLEAVGFTHAQIRRQFLGEGLALAAVGSVIGAAASAGYAQLVLLGLRTIWRGAVGTDQLLLHVRSAPLLVAALAGLLTAGLVILATLRGLRRLSPRALLTGATYGEARAARASRTATVMGALSGALAAGLLLAAATGRVPPDGAFFGAGASLLAAGLALLWRWLTRQAGSRRLGLVGLGLRSASHRPGRSLLCIALVAAAAFVIVSVGAFQHGTVDVTDPRSGAGGYTLLAESLLPVPYAFDTPEGRGRLALADDAPTLDGVRVARLRLKPGDDASCLNLYMPRGPRVLGAPADFIGRSRFRFAGVLAERPEEEANPWLTLDRRFADGAVPAIADQNSLQYVLKKKLGEELTIDWGRGPVRLRFVAALAGSLFQRELIIPEREFLRLFPEESGYRFFLIEAPPARVDAVTSLLESRLVDDGFDVSSTAERLASFFEVENTYLSTFQALGGLGLLLGTVGLGAVLLRNALERRRELALVRAVGFRRNQLRVMVLAENLGLLVAGIVLGAVSALVAVAPAALDRGGELPLPLLGGLLLAVAAAGLLASVLAVEAVTRTPLLPALKAE